MQVIEELERRELSAAEAKRKYGIKGRSTIQRWLRAMGRQELLTKVVRVEGFDERDRIKELEKQKRELESALAQTQLKVMALEKLIDVAEEHYHIDIKKNSGIQPPNA
jgi:transposase-like protein